MTIKELNELTEGAEQYTSWNGRTCYRTFGNLDWYFLKCEELGLEPKRTGDFSFEAQNEWLELDYCEHDIIITPKRFVAGTGENGDDEDSKQLEYTVINKMFNGIEIWNIGKHAPKNVIPLTRVDGTYHIDEKHMYAILTPKSQTVMAGVGFTGTTLKGMKKHLERERGDIRERVEKAIKILEEIQKRR